MGCRGRKDTGFTLVEMLIVVGMLGLVLAAVYSTYSSNLRAAQSQGEVLEVQQNLRVALDWLTRDLKMAGALLPPGTAPIATASGTSNISLNTASAEGRLARVQFDPPGDPYQVPGTPTEITLTVEPPASPTAPNIVDGFARGDHLRLIRPFDGAEPLGGTRSLVVADQTGNPARGVFGTSLPAITLAKSDGSTFLPGDLVRPGDLLAKVADPATYPMSVGYYLVDSGVSVNGYSCPAGQKCLVRQVNGPSGPADIVATRLASLSFSYLQDGYTEAAVPADPAKVRAVRITLHGTTARTAAASGARDRGVTTVVKLRNRR